MRSRLKGKIKDIAERRIKRLFELARDEAAQKPALARRYVKLARELARKSQLKVPKNLKRSFCKKCNLPFTPATARVRTRRGFVVYTCLQCGARRRLKL